MMTLVLKLMKSKFAAAGAVLIVALIIILMGPRIGLVRPYNYILAGLVLIGWLAWLIYQKLQAKKNASALEGFLNQQADDQLLTARPDVKDEIAALKEKLERAVKTLKQSKLAKGRHGSEALYVLPWFMIIGPSACGKSTAIRESGLSFPPIDPDSESPGAIKGLGGTRNCDWWFTNEGIILDTAGRYTISVDAAEDREEWTAFLELLKKFRKKSPINGLLVMVSVDELMQQDEDGVEAHARNIRTRVDELINKLEIIFPVYLVFTKCDLVSGFVEFFGDFKKREREQVWGYTCKYDPERTTPAHEEFNRETESLSAALQTRRVRKLHADMRPGDEKKVYLFPLEFGAVRRKLTGFVETLFQPNPFQQNPALRGVYFTSGTQEGTPIGQVMETMAEEFGIPDDIAPALVPAAEPKAYFIKDLFSQIIMSDSAGVRQTSGSRQRGKLARAALAGAVALVTILLLFALGASFLGNRSLLNETAEAVSAIKDVGSDDNDVDELERLDRIRRRLSALDKYEDDGVPWNLRWGLYKGNKINRAASNVMLARLTPMLMQPTVRKMESFLVSCPLDDQFWEMGPLYLDLTRRLDSADLDIGDLTKYANFVWGLNEDEDWQDDFRDPADGLITYWWRHRDVLGAQALSKNTIAFEQIKSRIQENYDLKTVYAELIKAANRQLKDIELVDIVSGAVLTGRLSVRGAYTKTGWETEVADRIRDSRKDIENDAFKSEALASELEGLEDYLFKTYVSHYTKAWQDFLEGIEVSSFGDISRAQDGLGELNDLENSPIFAVLKNAAENSILLRDDEPIDDIWGEFKGINRFLGREEVDENLPEEPSSRMENYLEYLKNADQALGDGKGNLDGEKNCGESLRRLANDLADSKEDIERLIRGSTLSGKATGLLLKPIGRAQAAAYSDACRCLDAAWESEVYEAFQDDLADKYPFNKLGSEADPADLITFFDKNGTLQKFHEDEAEPAERAGLQLPDAYTRAIRKGNNIRGIISGSRFRVSFTLIAESPLFDPDLQGVTFKMGDERSFEYSMGGPRERDYTWTGDDADCELVVVPSEGRRPSPLRETGRWSLFRLIDRGTVTGNAVAWRIDNHGVKYKIGGPNAAFILDGGFTFSCPRRLCGGR